MLITPTEGHVNLEAKLQKSKAQSAHRDNSLILKFHNGFVNVFFIKFYHVAYSNMKSIQYNVTLVYYSLLKWEHSSQFHFYKQVAHRNFANYENLSYSCNYKLRKIMQSRKMWFQVIKKATYSTSISALTALQKLKNM